MKKTPLENKKKKKKITKMKDKKKKTHRRIRNEKSLDFYFWVLREFFFHGLVELFNNLPSEKSMDKIVVKI
jgi:hypothetical protein